MLYFETERFILTTKFDMETNVNTTNKPQHDAKLPVSKSVCDHNKHGSRIVFGERRCAKCGVLFGKM